MHAAVLLGPLKALSYLLEHGLSSAALGALWRWRVHWSLSMAAGSVVRITSTVGVLALSSWALNEDLVALLMSNAYSMLVSILGMATACVALSLLHAHQCSIVSASCSPAFGARWTLRAIMGCKCQRCSVVMLVLSTWAR